MYDDFYIISLKKNWSTVQNNNIEVHERTIKYGSE